MDDVVVFVGSAGRGEAVGAVGYTNDYDEACPYPNSTSPDVVYSMTPTYGISVNIDLLGSTYDTKVYVYDEALTLVACNDDFYADYVSRIENVFLEGGVTYYLVIDGYGGAAGDYVLTIDEILGDGVSCPNGSELEDEPTIEDGYVDTYNGGCNSPEFGSPFGAITQPWFCGMSGWYMLDGGYMRDTDWFEIVVPDVGYVEIIGDADFETYMFELAPQDCGSVVVVQSVTCGPFTEATITIPGEVGSTIWFWVGPTIFDGPTNEYLYVLFTNLPGTVATSPQSWSSVKGLFN